MNKESPLYIIHTNLFSYIYKNNGSPEISKAMHFYFPFEDLAKPIDFLLAKLKVIKQNLITCNLKIKDLNQKKIINSQQTKPIDFKNKETAILIHDSFVFGGLYTKNHYFSDDISNPLHFSKLLFLRHSSIKKKLSPLDNYITPLQIKVDFRSFILSILFFINRVPFLRSLNELYGLLFLSSYYLKYLSWIEVFKKYKIKNLIYDYDIQVSKSLSLALEKLKIKTISIQDRHNLSFSFIMGL